MPSRSLSQWKPPARKTKVARILCPTGTTYTSPRAGVRYWVGTFLSSSVGGTEGGKETFTATHAHDILNNSLGFPSLGTDEPGKLSRYGDWDDEWVQDVALFSILSRPNVGPAQSPIEFVPSVFHSMVKRPERHADRTTLLATSSECRS